MGSFSSHLYHVFLTQGEQGPKGEKGDPGDPGALVSICTPDTAYHSPSSLKTRSPGLAGSRSEPHWPHYTLED